MPSIDWTESMQQTYEFYKVDPKSWFDISPIKTIKSATITRDSEDETLQHASLDGTDLNREEYIRIYMKCIQNGFSYKEPLGTFLIQSPSLSFDGKIKNNVVDAYSPLTELKEKKPPIGFSLLKSQNIMENVAQLTSDHLRAPVVKEIQSSKIIEWESGFVANTDDSWLDYLSDLIKNAEYDFDLDPMGTVLFRPYQITTQMQPVWTYSDDDNSILYPEITVSRDMYGVPNVVEIIHSSKNDYYVARAENNNPNSPISIISRGREILHRENSPDTLALATHDQLDAYASQLLKSLSTLEYRISYTHGYCPVRVGDCVRLSYKRAGLIDIKAKVSKQTITCSPGCSVKEEAIFTTNLLEV